ILSTILLHSLIQPHRTSTLLPYTTLFRSWKGHSSTDKSYPGDNRLISPKSSHRRRGLVPRCRLIASWGCSRYKGLCCSPIKAVHELGSERCEIVRSIYVVGVGSLRRSVLSTRGPGWTHRWCTSCSARSIAG